MKKISLLMVSIFLVGSSSSFTQLKSSEQIILSGNLHTDSKVLFESSGMQTQNISFPSPNKKSPMIAGLLSAVLPGAGEFYTESYLKAAIFAAVEVGVISVAVAYNKKGDNQTSIFQQYADQNWSVVKYAEWLNLHKGANIPIDQNTSLQPWQRINWEILNSYESGFSHRLYHHGDQQYYEMIGKYPQFSAGWPEFDPTNPNHNDVPQIMQDYSKMRGKANDYYNISDKAVIGIYINHLLSGLDAVWSAISFNNDVAVSVRVNPINTGENVTFYPTVNIRYAF